MGGVGTETLLPESNMYLASSTIPVSATAKQGYSFDYWHDPQGILFDTTLAETDKYFQDCVSAEITANFKVLEYNSSEIIISTNTGGTFILHPIAMVPFRTSVSTLFEQFLMMGINSVTGLEIKSVNLSNDPHYADNSLIVNGTINLEAVFTPSVYELSVSAIPENAGEVTGGGGFTLENDLVVTANSYPYWEFSGWSGDTSFLVSPSSSNSSFNFLVTRFTGYQSDRTFSKETYSFSAL